MRNKSSNPRRYRSWTREMVRDVILRRYQNGLPLTHRVILQEDPSLIVQIRRFYGTKKNLLKSCGIPTEGISKDRLLEILQEQSRITGGLNSNELRRIKIYGLVLKHFGSKTDAYKAIGLGDREIRRLKRRPNKWSEESVIRIIQEMKQNGNDISGGQVIKRDPSLYRAARTYFGSWNNALQNAGIHIPAPKVYRKHTKWDRKKIVEKLKELLIKYGDKRQIPEKERFKYYGLCRHYFGSSREAWSAAGAVSERKDFFSY